MAGMSTFPQPPIDDTANMAQAPVPSAPSPFKHCQKCGTVLVHRIPDDGDTRERAVCPSCGYIHYQNPLLVVGTLPIWDDGSGQEKILLCRRNIEPRRGKWTLPAGFLEWGEGAEAGALRETWEEAGLQVQPLGPFTFINMLSLGQIHMFYRAQVLVPDLAPGPETMEARYFAYADIPWDEIAFRTVSLTLDWYQDAKRDGNFALRCHDIA